MQGDANLVRLPTWHHLLDTFLPTPAPKELFRIRRQLVRDILEDLKRDYYEEMTPFRTPIPGCTSRDFQLPAAGRSIPIRNGSR